MTLPPPDYLQNQNDEPKRIRLTKDQEYAINWCYETASNRYGHTDKELIVNGVNITHTIKELLGKLF
jgi:hypothetical protein